MGGQQQNNKLKKNYRQKSLTTDLLSIRHVNIAGGLKQRISAFNSELENSKLDIVLLTETKVTTEKFELYTKNVNKYYKFYAGITTAECDKIYHEDKIKRINQKNGIITESKRTRNSKNSQKNPHMGKMV